LAGILVKIKNISKKENVATARQVTELLPYYNIKEIFFKKSRINSKVSGPH